jgi:hypothetical protein
MCTDIYRFASLQETYREGRESCRRAMGQRATILLSGGVMCHGEVVGRAREVRVRNGTKCSSRNFFETIGEETRQRLADNPQHGQTLFNRILFQGSTLERGQPGE